MEYIEEQRLNNELDEDESDFQPCDKCDLPDSCADFGCAVKQGIKQITWE